MAVKLSPSLKHFAVACLFAQLTGCHSVHQAPTSSMASFQPQSFEIDLTSETQGPASNYIRLANKSPSPIREQYLLEAASSLIKEQSLERAEQILSSIKENELPPELDNRRKLLSAHLHLLKSDTKTALAILGKIKNPGNLPSKMRAQYHKLLAHGYHNQGDSMRAVSQRLKLTQLLQDEGAQDLNRQKLWEELLKVDPVELQLAKLESEPNSVLSGWLELAQVSHSARTPEKLSAALKRWRDIYPHHPADGLLEANAQSVKSVSQVALLLPLTGPLAKPAQAIRDGFMAERFSGNQSLNVKVYDTTKADVGELYSKALQDGNQIVIGPLLKNNVNRLIEVYDGQVPVLTLNYSDSNSFKQGLYEYGLSPLDEVQQVAARGWQKGYRKIIVIAPEGPWGDFISNNFKQTWASFGGEIIDEWYFNPKQNYNQTIKELLNIDQSYGRIKFIKQIVQNNQIKSVPRRRRDIDMIFVLAYPSEMHKILPLLRFYYANDVDIMSASFAYLPGAPKRINRDLNGITFCDMPWVFDNDEPKFYQYSKSWPEYYNQYIRLFALGHDAFKLAEVIPRLPVLPSYAMKGYTGYLRIDDSNHIRRQLQWAQVINGKAQRV